MSSSIYLPVGLRKLYLDCKSAEFVSLKYIILATCVLRWLLVTSHCSSIVALLDLADESLGYSSLVQVIFLERSSPNLSAHLHSLMYVGGSVVTKPTFKLIRGSYLWALMFKTSRTILFNVLLTVVSFAQCQCCSLLRDNTRSIFLG